MHDIGGDPGAPVFSGGLNSILDRGDRLLLKIGNVIPRFGRLLKFSQLSSRSLLLALIGLLLFLLLLPLLMGWLLRRFRRVEPNFKGTVIPQSFGLVILLWSCGMLTLAAWLLPALRPLAKVWLLTLAGFGALGLLDDVWGDKKIKGLRGHFRAAWQEKRLTTGFAKAAGGLLLAGFVGLWLFRDRPAHALLTTGLIALGANAFNLLDLRPGRAAAVFLLCASGLLMAAVRGEGRGAAASPLLYVFLPTLPVWRINSRAQAMLGDVGSNLLGAAFGLAVAQSSLPTILKAGVFALLLILLHIAAERVSLSAVIERAPVLRTLDRLTGVR